MRWLVLVLLAGCMAPEPAINEAFPSMSPGLAILTNVTMEPTAWPADPCAQGAPFTPAPLMHPFDQGADVAMHHIGLGLGLDMSHANATPHHRPSGVQHGWVIQADGAELHLHPADEAPATVSVVKDHWTWNATTAQQSVFREFVDPDGALHFHTRYGHTTGHPSTNDRDGHATAWTTTWRGFPQTTVWIHPWQALPADRVNETVVLEAATEFAACAQPDAELRQARPWVEARHGTAVWVIQIQVPDPDHHCQGNSWNVLVDAQTGKALGREANLCI